ncbi:hypothetical protein DXG03_005422 [Asterophora parasitica]|uniref:Uncharacterized protein n=1 Tax=Asterophora parasitica TaxID=117018 RepID=A0A9P7G9G7_9AGAR|nr:hypothetical protein DXG03_005422 [Asterophora parasitica]
MAALSPPLTTSYEFGSFTQDSVTDPPSSMPKFPHTRAQLSAIARQHRPLDSNYDSDADGDDFSRVSSPFVNRIAALLADEQEDELKALLKNTYGMDDETLEQNVLDLMHKHRDDIAGVPFFYLTSTRRPMSRPSSRASNSNRLHARPDTPNSAPTSPLAIAFRRPHTPVTSPLAGGTAQPTSYMASRSDYSPQSSPILAHVQATHAHAQFTASLPASPLSSPRMLNAKASEFKPIPRPLSAAATTPGSYFSRTDTPSPDLWAHNSPRATSNLAIAAPLIADQSPSQQPRSLTPSSSLRTSHWPNEDEDDENDPFDPFAPGQAAPHSFHSITVSDYDNIQWHNTMPPYNFTESPPNELQLQDADISQDAQSLLTDGMTPFDVLSSVFGSTLAPSELEDALAANGYDFERAMAWLVDRAPPAAPAPQIRMQSMGGRVTLVSREAAANGRGGPPGRGNFANGNGNGPRYNNAGPGPGRGRPAPGGNRVCRYFMAGECLRADCRFSHDLERALCRFWLRGTCAKQEACEFLHHLPKDADISSLNIAMARANIAPGTGPLAAHTGPPPDDFPVLGYDSINGGANGAGRGRRGGYDRAYNDPGRTRFSNAVKKPAPAPNPTSTNNTNTDPAIAARMGGPSADLLHHHGRSAIVAPRASPRLKLRAPQLLPTLPTGEAVNSMYMTYRSRALQLGAARNACLSRAADAWRRGDGAAAKRFSREGHDLNAKMGVEMAGAAAKLVRERAKVAEQAVRARDATWSDDPGDRGARGNACGGGFGVCLGVAGRDSVGDGGKSSSEERMEAMLDLHGLHSNEATEVLEQFLLALENEHFYGLAYAIVGEEKHTGTQDVARGASRARLATGVREWLHRWGYPWSERDGIICIDPLTHASE